MKNRVKAAVLGLCVLTGVWTLVLFDSLQFYNKYVRDYYAHCEQEQQRYLEEYDLHVDFWIAKPYWEWNGGGLVLLAGFAVLCAWTTVVLKVKAIKDFIRRHKFDAAAMALMFAASFIVLLTYTRYRYNMDTVLFSDFDGRDAVLVDDSIPKTISLGTIDPLNPFVYGMPSIERLDPHGMPMIVSFYPLTEEQKTVVNWYETWGGIREHFIAPALYLSGKLLIKGMRRTGTPSRGDREGLVSTRAERKEDDYRAAESWSPVMNSSKTFAQNAITVPFCVSNTLFYCLGLYPRAPRFYRWVTGVKRPGRLIGLLIVYTILWIGLYGKALWDSSERVYRPDVPRATLNVAIITGLPLSAVWTIVAVKRRNILLACAATGTMLAFCFFAAANTETLGYMIERAYHTWYGRGYIVRLNPLLHLGGGSYISFYEAGIVLQSTMSIPNQLLYLAYGELIPFAITGLGLLTRNLARIMDLLPERVH